MTCPCGSDKIENPETGECASCGAARRKAERRKLTVKKPISKVSDKRKDQLKDYAVIRERFLLNRWCGVHGHPCVPTEVHHMKGKAGFADDKEIPLLIDTRFFLAVCRESHMKITEDSKWAISEGYSIQRTI